ncbi:MAG: SulP family inorganic anion transporter [Pedobacter sp.]|nr:MAG: SulP family inorganic anion transporter [Pedobacter sp.]
MTKSYLNLFDFSQKVNYRTEILAGFTVAMTMIPESLSFAILAGFNPLTGLYAAFIMGLITAIFGGRPGMVSGGAGATVVVLIALMQSHGVEYVFAAIVLAGLLQIFVGLLKLGKFIKLVPQPVMYGFVNGLAIVIFMAQLEQFKVMTPNGSTWMTGTALFTMLGLVLLTILLVWIWPKISKAIPASLVAIMVVFFIVLGLGIETKTVKDIASVSGGFPPFHFPKVVINFETLQIIFPYALVMAAVGLIESLLTMNVVDEITGTKGNGNREALAQGAANMTNGLFTGMGGCAMIAQSFVNLSAGSRARLSGIVASVMILVIILVGAPVIELVPMAALTGVMFMVAIGTFEWISFRVINKMPLHDVLVGIIVAGLTVWLHNLALAVLMGVILSALVFAWESAKRIRARKFIDEDGVKHYNLFGPLFFGSTTAFLEKFDVQGDPDKVIVNFKESRIADMSALEALNKLTSRYEKINKTLYITGLSADSRILVRNANTLIKLNVKD